MSTKIKLNRSATNRITVHIARTAYLLFSSTDTDPARIQRDYFAAFDTSEDIARKLLIRDQLAGCGPISPSTTDLLN